MAQYREGRVTVTNDSDIVSGTDTQWMANINVGDVFLIRGDEVPYRVAAVLTDTSLRLSARYAAPTESNSFYSITRDFTEYLSLPIIRNGDVDAIPLVAEGFIQIDAAIGTGGGGGGGSSTFAGLTDVTLIGAQSGDQFTLLPNGSFGFIRPASLTVTFDHAPGDGGRIIKSNIDNVVTARRIKVSGGTITENADDLTINVPPPGEVNTLVSAGSAQSNSIALPKSGTTLRTAGLRSGTGMSITQEGNDLVLAVVGGTGGGGGITYTMASVGAGVSIISPPSGTEFRLKALLYDNHFTVADDLSGSLSVKLNKISATDIDPLQWTSITAGQVLTRNSSNQIVGTTLPSPGISSLIQDTSPILGGPLNLSGHRIVDQPVSFSGVIERPKLKSYVVCISSPVDLRVESAVLSTAAGSVNFRVDIDVVPEDTLEGTPNSPLQGTATVGKQPFSSQPPMDVLTGQQIILTVRSTSPDSEDFTFTILGATV